MKLKLHWLIGKASSVGCGVPAILLLVLCGKFTTLITFTPPATASATCHLALRPAPPPATATAAHESRVTPRAAYCRPADWFTASPRWCRPGSPWRGARVPAQRYISSEYPAPRLLWHSQDGVGARGGEVFHVHVLLELQPVLRVHVLLEPSLHRPRAAAPPSASLQRLVLVRSLG